MQHDPESGFYGFVPAEGTLHARNGQTISRHFFDGEPGTNRFDRYQRMVGYHLEHRINDALTARQNARYLSMDIDYDQVYARTFDGQSDRLQRGAVRSNESLSAYALDNQLQLDVDTGPVKHTLLAGLDYQHRQNTGTWQFGTASALDAFAPRYGTPDIEYGAPTRWRHKVEQTGIYLQDQLALGGWRLSLGGRHDWARATNDARDTGSSSRDNQSQFSGRAGLLYAFENGLSPYLSYSESFNPNTRADASGEVLGPTEGQQYEAGIKYQPPGTRDHYTASLYRLTQTNVAEAADVPAGTPTYYEAIGKVRTRGVELSATTRLTEQFSLLAAYTYTDMEYVKTNDDTEGNTPYEVPRHMASLWGRYDLDNGLLNGVSVGAGARYIGSSWADSDNTTRVGAHTLIDAMLAYDLGKLSPELSGLNARVNATNLLDETYVSSCTSLRNCYYGQERSVTATVSYQF